jgi:hypothetical protein
VAGVPRHDDVEDQDGGVELLLLLFRGQEVGDARASCSSSSRNGLSTMVLFTGQLKSRDALISVCARLLSLARAGPPTYIGKRLAVPAQRSSLRGHRASSLRPFVDGLPAAVYGVSSAAGMTAMPSERR